MMRARETQSGEGAGCIADSSGEITMPPGSDASIDGRAVTAEYDLRNHAAKPVSPKAVRRELLFSRCPLCSQWFFQNPNFKR